MSTKNLKLWVMENVLSDYTDGLVCVYAETEVQAWDLLQQQYPVYFFALNGFTDDKKPFDERPNKFRCIDKPEAFAVHGGG